MSNQRGIQTKTAGSRMQFYSIAKGWLYKTVAEPTAKSKPHTIAKGPNTGKIVHREYDNQIVGALIDIRKKNSKEFEPQLELVLNVGSDDEPDYVNIQTSFGGGYGNSILKRLPNLDLTKDVMIETYCFLDKKTNEEVTSVLFKQHNGTSWSKVEQRFTKETPNGIPPLKSLIVNNKPVWDSTEQQIFLEQVMDDTARHLPGYWRHQAQPQQGGQPISEANFPNYERETSKPLEEQTPAEIQHNYNKGTTLQANRPDEKIEAAPSAPKRGSKQAF